MRSRNLCHSKEPTEDRKRSGGEAMHPQGSLVARQSTALPMGSQAAWCDGGSRYEALLSSAPLPLPADHGDGKDTSAKTKSPRSMVVVNDGEGIAANAMHLRLGGPGTATRVAEFSVCSAMFGP